MATQKQTPEARPKADPAQGPELVTLVHDTLPGREITVPVEAVDVHAKSGWHVEGKTAAPADPPT